MDGSLRRLQTDRLDALPLHRPDALTEPEEIASAFDELRRAGKVLDFGVSNHNAAQMERAPSRPPCPSRSSPISSSSACGRHGTRQRRIPNRPQSTPLHRLHGLLDTCLRLGVGVQACVRWRKAGCPTPAPTPRWRSTSWPAPSTGWRRTARG
ncbi:MAG: aldo/keto reductase [Kiritimatiellia bacterium]